MFHCVVVCPCFCTFYASPTSLVVFVENFYSFLAIGLIADPTHFLNCKLVAHHAETARVQHFFLLADSGFNFGRPYKAARLLACMHIYIYICVRFVQIHYHDIVHHARSAL